MCMFTFHSDDLDFLCISIYNVLKYISALHLRCIEKHEGSHKPFKVTHKDWYVSNMQANSSPY
jgi:hypothetical protein